VIILSGYTRAVVGVPGYGRPIFSAIPGNLGKGGSLAGLRGVALSSGSESRQVLATGPAPGYRMWGEKKPRSLLARLLVLL
jgi:hypothetical protein